MSIIALITDFGRQDWYVSSMKGVILSIDGNASVVDVSHEIAPGDIRSAGFVLSQCYREHPGGTVFVTVVDPGVGTERKSIAVKASEHYVVGPNNGLFSFLAWNEGERNLQIYEIENLPDAGRIISSTFHGRDIFAPAAAYISSGMPLEKIGPALDLESFEVLERPEANYLYDRADGEVVYIDHFGNAMTSLEGELLENIGTGQNFRVESVGFDIPVVRTFGEVAHGKPLAYIGSGGRLEIAVNCGNAAEALKIGVGCQAVVRLRD